MFLHPSGVDMSIGEIPFELETKIEDGNSDRVYIS